MVIGLADADLLEIVKTLDHLTQRSCSVPLGIQTEMAGLLVAVVYVYMIVVCKLTVAGGYKHINIDQLSRGQMPQSSQSCNMSDVDAVSPGPVESEPADIEPVHFSDLDDVNVEH